jgi:3-deoxy-7-phosphoheptulonate synthase
MMIVMQPGASPEEVEAVRARVAETGVHVLVLPGELTTAIGAIGDPEAVRELALEGMAGVDRVVPISRPYKLAAAELGHHGPSSFDIAGRTVGGDGTFCLIAGPCTVESREQTIGVARAVQAAGASMLRGGAFKPRTSPFAFKGLGVEALEILAEARAQTGLPVVTEFLDASHADVIAEHADVVQIGARNMQNYALLEVAGKLGKPVLLKRGLSSSLDELLQAADYVLKEGNERVVLCERGIRTFETATRFTLDLGAVPWLKLHSHLPVVVTRRTPRATAGWSSRCRGPPRRWAPTASSSRSTRTPSTRCATAPRRSTPAASRSTRATSRRMRGCSARSWPERSAGEAELRPDARERLHPPQREPVAHVHRPVEQGVGQHAEPAAHHPLVEDDPRAAVRGREVQVDLRDEQRTHAGQQLQVHRRPGLEHLGRVAQQASLRVVQRGAHRGPGAVDGPDGAGPDDPPGVEPRVGGHRPDGVGRQRDVVRDP